MDAIILREAGGFGDILQVGSVVPFLQAKGYTVHFYTMSDPAIVELVKLIRGISYVHPLRMVLKDRRQRTDVNIRKHPYLYPVSTHVLGTGARPPKNKLFDMFCPAWRFEQIALNKGSAPGGSRAQAFVVASGFDESQTKPTKLKRPPNVDGLMRFVTAKLGDRYIIYAPTSKDYARLVPPALAQDLLGKLVDNFGPVVVLAHNRHHDERPPSMPNVLWYPWDFSPDLDRSTLMLQTIELVSHARAAVVVDSFTMHLAGSFGIPTICIGGPTITEIVSNHYPTVHPCNPSGGPQCCGCYYRAERGFVPAKCRDEKLGCRVIGSVTSGDLLPELERLL